jgi:hypothetical protein
MMIGRGRQNLDQQKVVVDLRLQFILEIVLGISFSRFSFLSTAYPDHDSIWSVG